MSAGENAFNNSTTWFYLVQILLIYFNIWYACQYSVSLCESVRLSVNGQLVELLITLEPHVLYKSNFTNLYVDQIYIHTDSFKHYQAIHMQN